MVSRYIVMPRDVAQLSIDPEDLRMFQNHLQPGHRGRHHHDPIHGPADHGFSVRDIFRHGRSGRHGVRRGEVRPLILSTLAQRPMHGYEVIQELETQSGGRWRPSAGSVYPTLQLLSDEGLVTSEEVDGRRTYTLTEAGRDAAAAAPSHAGWTDDDGDSPRDARRVAMQLVQAALQVQSVGSPGARREAVQILTDARRAMYRLLAEDDQVATDEPGETA
jgi:DNA-binding PadR family transcriptional regulator